MSLVAEYRNNTGAHQGGNPKLRLASSNGIMETSKYISHIRLVCFDKPDYETMTAPGLLDRAFELRHRVFAEINEWEKPRPSRRERDIFDPHSSHYMLVGNDNNGTDHILSYVRFVHPEHETGLPVCQTLKAAGGNLTSEFEGKVKAGSVAEVSRFLVNPATHNVLVRQAPLRIAGIKTLNLNVKASDTLLYHAHQDMLERYPNITRFAAIMKEDLHSKMQRFALGIDRVGDTVDHRGQRTPITMNPHSIRNRLVRGALGQFFNSNLEGVLHICPQSEIDRLSQQASAQGCKSDPSPLLNPVFR